MNVGWGEIVIGALVVVGAVVVGSILWGAFGPRPPNTGIITGTVRGVTVDGPGVAGATVSVVSPEKVYPSTVTDAEGKFRFENVPVGDWKLSAIAKGYGPGYVGASIPAPGATVDVVIVMPLGVDKP